MAEANPPSPFPGCSSGASRLPASLEELPRPAEVEASSSTPAGIVGSREQCPRPPCLPNSTSLLPPPRPGGAACTPGQWNAAPGGQRSTAAPSDRGEVGSVQRTEVQEASLRDSAGASTSKPTTIEGQEPRNRKHCADLKQGKSGRSAEQTVESEIGEKDSPIRPCRKLAVVWNDLTFQARISKTRPSIFGVPPLSDILNAFDAMTGRGSMKQILLGVSGAVYPGDMVALMGASGAGKSTLLNVLSRRIQNNGGFVKYGDVAVDLKTAKKLSCYIQQDDLFNGFITVREHLECMVRLRTNLGTAEGEALVERLLITFGLSKAADNCIGNLQMGARRGISGGEKKRLTIATEILTNPSIIFADEPTTGLDSFIAESIMSVFEALALRGRTVICTIHQPSTRVFEMFNKVMLLAEGRVVFSGDRLALPPYFALLGSPMPAYTSVPDFVLDVLSTPDAGDTTRDLALKLEQAWKERGIPFMKEWEEGLREKYLDHLKIEGILERFGSVKRGGPRHIADAPGERTESSNTHAEESPSGKKKDFSSEVRVSWWTQFRVLLHRGGLANKRNPQVLQARIGQTLVSALLIGFIFFRLDKDVAVSKNGAANIINLNQGITGLAAVLQTFTSDKVVAVREYRAGTYSLVPYYLAKTTSDLGFQIFNPLVFFTMVWYMMNLNDSAVRWLWGLAFIFLQTNASISIGYLVSCLSPDMEVALACMPLVTMPLALVSGFMIILDSLPRFWIWLPYLSPYRWAWSGIMHAIWEDIKLDPCPAGLRPPACYNSGNEVLRYYCIDNDKMWLNALFLIIHLVGYRVLGLVALIILNRRN